MGLTMCCKTFLTFNMNDGIFYVMMSIPRNIDMNMNNVMNMWQLNLETPKFNMIVSQNLPKHCANWSNYRCALSIIWKILLCMEALSVCVWAWICLGLQLYERIWKEWSHVCSIIVWAYDPMPGKFLDILSRSRY